MQTGWNRIAGANKDMIVNYTRSKFDNLAVPQFILGSGQVALDIIEYLETPKT